MAEIKQMEGWLNKYNGAETAHYRKTFARLADNISCPIAVVGSGGLLNPNVLNFWVNVPQQDAGISSNIRRICADSGLHIPPDYNNIAMYFASQDTWGLKFSCW